MPSSALLILRVFRVVTNAPCSSAGLSATQASHGHWAAPAAAAPPVQPVSACVAIQAIRTPSGESLVLIKSPATQASQAPHVHLFQPGYTML